MGPDKSFERGLGCTYPISVQIKPYPIAHPGARRDPVGFDLANGHGVGMSASVQTNNRFISRINFNASVLLEASLERSESSCLSQKANNASYAIRTETRVLVNETNQVALRSDWLALFLFPSLNVKRIETAM